MAAGYTSMYLIADTAESIWTHRKLDFSSDPFASYLEFWGVMQAIVIQQDAICELYNAVVSSSLPIIPKASAWKQLRDLRTQCAGHPANRSRGVPKPQRSFMGRMRRTYANVTYEMWDAHTRKTTHPSVNLGKLIDSYDIEASQTLGVILQTMKFKWP
jgi:hypothetical protein